MLRKSLLLSALLFIFLTVSVHFVYAATTASFSTSYDPNNSNNIVVGETVVFTNTSVTDGTIGSVSWSMDGVPFGTGLNCIGSFATTGWHTVSMTIQVSNEDFPITVSRQFNIKPWAVYLKSVGFKAATGAWHVIYRDIEQTPYSNVPNEPFAENPQWEDNSDPLNGNATDSGDKKYPVAYTSGSQMQVQVIIHGKGPVPEPLYIKGINADGFDFGSAGNVQVSWTSDGVSGVGCNVLNCEQNFDSNKVKFWENFDIDWKVKCGTGNFETVGHSKNDMHITWHDPISGAYSYENLYHTLAYIACHGANDQTTETSIIAGIWDEFKDATVNRRQDGLILNFFNDWYLSRNTHNETSELLNSRDGTYSAWAKFLLDCLKVHGIHEDNNYYELTVDSTATNGCFRAMIKNWGFSANPTSLDPNFPYSNVFSTAYNNSYDWRYKDVMDETGLKGQGNKTNPKSIVFTTDYPITVCKIGSNYYLPQYAEESGSGFYAKFASLDALETGLVDGYLKNDTVAVQESTLGVDLSDPTDGDTLDTVTVLADLIIQNPTGNQLSVYLCDTK